MAEREATTRVEGPDERRSGSLKRFREHYARSRGRLLAGERDVVFPMGAYRWRLLGIACVPPPLA